MKGTPEQALGVATRAGKHATEGWRVRKDGSRFWASALIEAVHDDAGALIGFAKITRDMTERVAVEERLRQSQKMEGSVNSLAAWRTTLTICSCLLWATLILPGAGSKRVQQIRSATSTRRPKASSALRP